MKLIKEKYVVELAAEEMELIEGALARQAALHRINGNIARKQNKPNQEKRDELTKKTQELYSQFFWVQYDQHGPYRGNIPKKSKVP